MYVPITIAPNVLSREGICGILKEGACSSVIDKLLEEKAARKQYSSLGDASRLRLVGMFIYRKELKVTGTY